MEPVSRLFSINQIYKVKTGVGLLVDYGLAMLVVLFFATSHFQIALAFGSYVNLFQLFLVVGGLVMAYAFSRDMLIWWLAQRWMRVYRRESGTAILPGSGIPVSAVNEEYAELPSGAILKSGTGWRLVHVQFPIYRRTKYGRYIAARAVYTVADYTLRRQVPNILFDSRRAKSRQFRKLFLKSQRLSMDVNFDDAFDTYAPHHYKIDTLSFISPEVLHIIRSNDHYDYELVGDHLLVFGPMLPTDASGDIVAQAEAVATAINDNLDTYRDSYLQGADRATKTTSMGWQLLTDPREWVVATIALAGLLIGLAVAALITKNYALIWNQAIIILVFLIGSSAKKAYSIIHYNRQVEAEFNRHYRSGKHIST